MTVCKSEVEVVLNLDKSDLKIKTDHIGHQSFHILGNTALFSCVWYFNYYIITLYCDLDLVKQNAAIYRVKQYLNSRFHIINKSHNCNQPLAVVWFLFKISYCTKLMLVGLSGYYFIEMILCLCQT